MAAVVGYLHIDFMGSRPFQVALRCLACCIVRRAAGTFADSIQFRLIAVDFRCHFRRCHLFSLNDREAHEPLRLPVSDTCSCSPTCEPSFVIEAFNIR